MALDKLTKVQSVGISSFIQVVGVVTATQGFDGNITGIITATGDFSIEDKIVHTGDTNTAIRFPAADTFTVETAGSEALRVDSSQRLMIGTQTPGPTAGEHLTIADSANTGITIRSGTTAAGSILFEDDTADRGEIQYSHNGDFLRIKTAGSERLRITSTGQQQSHAGYAGVGINTFASWARTGGAIRAEVGYNAVTTDYMYFGTGTNHPLALRVNNSNALYIKNDANRSVGIGTDNPTEKLDINGGLKVYANTNIATFKNNQLRSDAAGAYYFDHGTTGQSFTFRTSTSSSLDTTGPSVTSAGNISFPSGKGIDFSANSNASGMTSELLDDYEEGNFTPIVRGRTTAGTATYGRTAVGKYTKVGRMVDVMVDMVFSGANGGGNIEIAGLPFAAHSGPYVRFAGDVTLLTAGISWSNQIACYINDTNSHFWITNTPTSGNYTFVNINSNTTEILLHCTYMVS